MNKHATDKLLFKASRFINPQTHLTFTRQKFQGETPTHLHDYYELELILEGEGEQNLNGSIYPLKSGTLYLVTPIDFHRVSSRGSLTILNISFDETLLSPQWQLYFMNRRTDLFFTAEGQEKSHWEALFSMIEAEITNHDSYAADAHKRLLELLFIAIARKAAPAQSTCPLSVQRSMQYIFQHFRDNLTLSEIAAESGYTSHYFSTLFHRETGRCLTDFLTELRLNYAKMLLSTTDLPVTDICEKSGFGSLSNFFRLFAQQQNCSPMEYRKRKNR